MDACRRRSKRPREGGPAPAPPSSLASSSSASPSAPFRGPAADSRLGELLLDVLPLACGVGHALDLHRVRFVCGLTLRERAAPGCAVATRLFGDGVLEARRADGVRVVRLPWATLYTRERVDERGYAGGTADMIARATRRQAPWLAAARAAPRAHHRLRERTTQLMRAAGAGDERRVRELLAAGASHAACDNSFGRWSALHWAARDDHARVAEALLAAGAAVDVSGGDGQTPLLVASLSGSREVARALLARGARQERQDTFGFTALHWAAAGDDAPLVELLLAAPGAAIALAKRDCNGSTPLAIAEARAPHGACAGALRLRAS